MMRIVERYKLWKAIRNSSSTIEAPDIRGGREAEHLLLERIGESFRFKGAEVFAGRRVPSRLQNRRREIDLIVCEPRQIHLIEIKNWSGRLDLRGRDWIQTRRSGESVNHVDLLAENLLKREAVLDYLLEHGIPVDKAFASAHLAPAIMFMNASLEIDPKIEELPEVYSKREVDRFLVEPKAEMGLVDRFAKSLISLCFHHGDSAESTHERIEPKLYRKIVQSLSDIATWDRLGFFGSATLTGDLLSIHLSSRSLRRADIVEIGGDRFISIHWTRHAFLGWIKVLTGLGSLGWLRLGREWFKLGLEDAIVFQAAGEREAKTWKMVGVDRLALG